MGSRYGGLKQVDAVGPGGEAIIDYSIFDAIRAGFGKVVFVIRREIETAFREKFGNSFEQHIAVEYVFQETDSPVEGIERFPPREKPWGTAHAMLVARDVVKEPFAVINADDYYGVEAFEVMARFLTDACRPDFFSMVGYVITNTISDHGTVNRGVAAMDAEGMLTQVDERLKIQRRDGVISYQDDEGGLHSLGDDELVSMNFWGFHPDVFEAIRQQFVAFVYDHAEQPKAEFFIPLFVDRMVKDGSAQVAVLTSNDKWYGVTYQEDKEPVQAAFRALTDSGAYPSPLWAGQ